MRPVYQIEIAAPVPRFLIQVAGTGISHLAQECHLEAPLLIKVSAEFVCATAAIEAVRMGLQKGPARARVAEPALAGVHHAAAENAWIKTKKFESLERLMQFFPHGSRVRIPVSVSRSFSPEPTATLIEYGTSREVIFRFPLPLEFGERVRLASQDGLLNTEAEILAVQLSQSETLVAARFSGEVPNWIIKA